VTHPLNQNDDTGRSTDEYEWDDGDDSTHSPVAAVSNAIDSATVVTASCDVCLNSRMSKLPQYRVDMQLFVSNALTRWSPPILAVMCVAVSFYN